MNNKIFRKTGEISEELAKYAIHPVLRQIYAHRGIHRAADLDRGLSHLLPYYLLLHSEKAAQILAEALIKQQKIVIVGDYDVDGATATVLALRVLRAFGAKQVDGIIPDRIEDGHGINASMVDKIKTEHNPQLLITVDNGITSHEGIARAKELGMVIIITDHHLPSDKLPAADAIVNPNQPNDNFPSKMLSGVGVFFYLCMALRAHLRALDYFQKQQIPDPNLATYLDLVALGTIADVVPLDRNNRILVYQGLQRIRAGACCEGIKALLSISNRRIENATSTDLAFAVSPRLNAAGRLHNMEIGVSCLLADDYAAALHYAKGLNRLNNERRQLEKAMHDEAKEIVRQDIMGADIACTGWPFGVCIKNEKWHLGVIGILASRICAQIRRPVVVFAPHEEKYLKGSARSVPKLSIREVFAEIAACYPSLVVQYGGHAMAAGIMIHRDRFDEFSKAFDKVIRSRLTEEDFLCQFVTDGLLACEYISVELAELLREAGPWGQDFPEPLFEGRFRVVNYTRFGDNHLKFLLELDSKRITAVAFNVADEEKSLEEYRFIAAVYRLSFDDFRRHKCLRLVLEYFEPV